MSEKFTKPAERVPLKFSIEFRRSYGRRFEQGRLRNISLSGAFLEHDQEAIGMHDKILITFKVGGRTRKVHARVIWINKEGSGIQFLPQTGRDVQIVDDLIYFVENQRENTRSIIHNIFQKAS